MTADEQPHAGGMPTLGLGTWQLDDPETCRETVRFALEAGYRHVDTAQAYGNEAAVGDGIAAADVPREDVFLATKVWTDRLSYDDVISSTADSVDELGVDSLDLLYVHWPTDTYDPEGTLRAFDELYAEGTIDRVGVSNFSPARVEEAVERLDAPVFANQVECHPLFQQRELRATCEAHDVEVVAYSPLARGAVFDDPTVAAVAEARDVSAAQVSLAWLRAKGVTAIPKASGEAHLRDNLASLDLELTDDEVDAIDAIDVADRQVDPDWAPWHAPVAGE